MYTFNILRYLYLITFFATLSLSILVERKDHVDAVYGLDKHTCLDQFVNTRWRSREQNEYDGVCECTNNKTTFMLDGCYNSEDISTDCSIYLQRPFGKLPLFKTVRSTEKSFYKIHFDVIYGLQPNVMFEGCHANISRNNVNTNIWEDFPIVFSVINGQEFAILPLNNENIEGNILKITFTCKNKESMCTLVKTKGVVEIKEKNIKPTFSTTQMLSDSANKNLPIDKQRKSWKVDQVYSKTDPNATNSFHKQSKTAFSTHIIDSNRQLFNGSKDIIILDRKVSKLTTSVTKMTVIPNLMDKKIPKHKIETNSGQNESNIKSRSSAASTTSKTTTTTTTTPLLSSEKTLLTPETSSLKTTLPSSAPEPLSALQVNLTIVYCVLAALIVGFACVCCVLGERIYKTRQQDRLFKTQDLALPRYIKVPCERTCNNDDIYVDVQPGPMRTKRYAEIPEIVVETPSDTEPISHEDDIDAPSDGYCFSRNSPLRLSRNFSMKLKRNRKKRMSLLDMNGDDTDENRMNSTTPPLYKKTKPRRK